MDFFPSNDSLVDELFPKIPYNVDPIIPKGTNFNLNKLNIPKPPDDFYVANPYQSQLLYEPIIGFSNNWVVRRKLCDLFSSTSSSEVQ